MPDHIQCSPKTIGRGLALLIFFLSATSFALAIYDFSNGLDDIRSGVSLITLYYTNIIAAFTAIAFLAMFLFWPKFSSANVVGHIVVSLAILVVHYWFFRGWDHYVSSALRNKIAHGILPALVFVFWVAFANKSKLTWRSPLAWTAFASTYTSYALLRGAITGEYAYDVGNVANLGYAKVLGLVLVTAFLSVFFGYVLLFVSVAPVSLRQSLPRLGFARISPERRLKLKSRVGRSR